jgi:CRP/FNR family transcriptional regulator, anaerobic regulatory protein
MNTSQIIKQAFDPYFNAPIEAWEAFAKLGKVITTKKNEVIKPTNTTENHLSFILNGSGGILLWNKSQFVCIDLCYEGDFFGDYMSFLTQTGTPLEVITFEPSTLFQISRSNFEKLSFNTAFGDKICRFAAEGLFIHKQTQQIHLLTQSVMERYAELVSKQPKIIQRTPQKHIASYLGISPQSLSRIRKEFVQKN